jgi:hypothetical protein
MRADSDAETILTVLEQHPGGLTMRMLLHETGLTSGQYRSAYNWVFDNLDEPVWTKRYIGGEWVYMTTETAGACDEDWARTVKTQVTRARREHAKARAFATAHPSTERKGSELEAEYRLRKLQLEKERLSA